MNSVLRTQTNTSETATHLGKTITGYEPGEISAKGCMLAEILMPGIPLQPVIDQQYLDSKTMSRRPGMILKYLPVLYDEVTGKLLSGGAYLFETYDDAKDYVRWAGEEFMVGEPKVVFAKQPAFEAFKGTAWKVVGAHSCLPIDEHSVTRFMRWRCKGTADLEAKLQDFYPQLRDIAKDENDVASIWLLYNPETASVALQTGFKKSEGPDVAGAKHTLEKARELEGLEDFLSSLLGVAPEFDRTSLILTLWLPKSRSAGGAELTVPYYPMVPDITHDHT